ncbi:MAG: three-Cys-motif partner protein TcmP [Balneolaceae bacterium]|nr:three-Cys-motif partner protein TcmP [Balneolaceae bacterium]
MMVFKDSQLNMYEHSQAKIELLSTYMDRYLNIINSAGYYSDVIIYDMFCGQGIYKNGGKGSPIIFLERVKKIHYDTKAKGNDPVKFHCYFNDKDEEKIEKLKSSINENNLYYPDFGQLELTTDDYREILERGINNFRSFSSEKGFVFIDPYGYGEIKAEDIKRLLQTGNSEVLLFLPTQNMFRFVKKGTPECLQEFISELVPESEWPESNTGLDFIETLVQKFRAFLDEQCFVDSFVIARGVNQYFCLFFFTSHIRGFEKMLESKWKIDEEEGRGWKFRMGSDLFAEVEKTPKINRLKDGLINFLQSPRINAELYEFGLTNGFLPTHVKAVLQSFQNDGLLEVRLKDGTIARKGAFYVNYENYKKIPDRVRIRLIK